MLETQSRAQLTKQLQLVKQLQGAIRHCEGFRADFEEGVFSSGCAAIDRLLPERGLRSGMLVEWLAQVPGSAAALVGLINCREACQEGGMLVVIDRQQSFYPPVAIAWGLKPQQMIVVHPATLSDHVWALVQALESPAVTAVWSAVDRIDSKTFQRVRLAAQTGNTLGVFLRPAVARGQPSWSDVQFWVTPISKGSISKGPFSHGPISQVSVLQSSCQVIEVRQVIEVQLARCRGAKSGGSAVLEIDATNGFLRETTQRGLRPQPNY